MGPILVMLLALGLPQSAEPTTVLDGTSWKITFPAKGPKGNALEIANPDFSRILGGQDALPKDLMKYFQFDNNEVVFVTRYTGVTTSSGTKYSRTELREMLGNEEHNWTLAKGGTLECRLKVSALAGGAKKTIFMQIHGKAPRSEPLLKCLWEKGYIRLLTKSGPNLKDFSRKPKYLQVGEDEWFTCALRVDREALCIAVNGETIETFGPDVLDSWPQGNTYYFKAGNYLQHNTEGAEATVRFSSIKVSH